MKTETRTIIIAYIKSKGMAGPSEIASYCKISNQALHAQLRKLVSEGVLRRLGSPPKTLYAPMETKRDLPKLGPDLEALIEAEFSFLSPTGELESGVAAFQEWVRAKKLERDFETLAGAYKKVWHSVYGSDKATPLDTTNRLSGIHSELALDAAYISDFYALPQFGKTPLGNLVHVVKTAYQQVYMDRIVQVIKQDLNSLMIKLKVDTVLFYPHSIPRKKQLMPSLKKALGLGFAEIYVRKVFYGDIPVAQKSLPKIQDRILNAQKTIFIEDFSITPHNVLVLDDAIGSGATLNELAKILKGKYGIKRCYAYALVGSYKGFDVISAV
jgi:DNA-binding HxlR family transcriptional regulator